MTLSRRVLLLGTSGLTLSGLTARAFAQTPSQAERLMAPGALSEKAFGDEKAPVTVVEYASLTCHHCQSFHKNTWPAFKAKYVDTGKVRFVMREFPLDALAAAGFMLARCSGDDKWYPVIDILYQTGESWNHAEKPLEALAQVMRQTGMSREQFDACLRDEKLYRGVAASGERGSEMGVSSTPTFFVNGEKHVGALTLEQFDEILAPLLPKTAP